MKSVKIKVMPRYFLTNMEKKRSGCAFRETPVALAVVIWGALEAASLGGISVDFLLLVACIAIKDRGILFHAQSKHVPPCCNLST